MITDHCAEVTKYFYSLTVIKSFELNNIQSRKYPKVKTMSLLA